ncbi:MAG: hypothetical protein ACPGR2_15475 [Psychrobium sp.]
MFSRISNLRFSKAIVLSLVIHGLLLVVIAAQINVGAAKKHQKFAKEIKQQQAITAKLVITPPAPIVVKPPESPQEKAKQKIEKKLVLPKISAEPTPQKIVKPQEPKPQAKQKAKVVAAKKPAVEPKIQEKPKEKIEEKARLAKPVKEPEPIANRAALMVEEPAAKSSTSTLSVLERSRAFIRQQTSAAPQYEIEGQNAGMSDMNNSFPVHDYQFIEEKTIDEKSEIKITCDTTLKKITAGISSSLLGGTLRCKPGADLSKFIKAKEKPKFQYKLPENDEDKKAND